MFKTVEREAVTVYGWITTLNAPNLLAVNAVIDGEQCYLIGNTETTETRPSEFELPAGTYACFNLNYKDQVELDQLIGRSYGELAQSEDFQIAGNFNLEEYTGVGKVLFYVPIQKMKK